MRTAPEIATPTAGSARSDGRFCDCGSTKLSRGQPISFNALRARARTPAHARRERSRPEPSMIAVDIVRLPMGSLNRNLEKAASILRCLVLSMDTRPVDGESPSYPDVAEPPPGPDSGPDRLTQHDDDGQCPGAVGWRRRTPLSGRGYRWTLSEHDGDGGQQVEDGPASHKEIIANKRGVIDRVAAGCIERLVNHPPCAVLGGLGPAEI